MGDNKIAALILKRKFENFSLFKTILEQVNQILILKKFCIPYIK